MPDALFPLPGSKAARKYDRYLYPPTYAEAMVEPFMGSAARSIRYHHLPTYLGEIDPGKRAIALALQAPLEYELGYKEAFNLFGCPKNKELLLDFAAKKLEKAQKQFRRAHREVCDRLSHDWESIQDSLYRWRREDPGNPLMAGYYGFAIRAAFGNGMRLNPKGTAYNNPWHIEKASNAITHDPVRWLEELRSIRWNPVVLGSWEEAIAAVPTPSKSWCLLDPPYWVDGKTHRCTPCYEDHSIGTKGDHAETLALATDSLIAALERGFPVIDVCNYYSPQLDEAVGNILSNTSYHYQMNILGECKALGNSNGSRKHGNRVDKREKPIEVIYRVSKTALPQRRVRQQVRAEQLSLLEVG